MLDACIVGALPHASRRRIATCQSAVVHDRPDICKIFPQVVTTSKSTVLGWMHARNAKYKRYRPGFVDRRNDADVLLQVKEYLLKEHQINCYGSFSTSVLLFLRAL